MSNIFVPEGQFDRVAIMAPGPTLSKEQVSQVIKAGIFTIAIGDAYLINPWADLLYHCDARWWEHYKGVPDFHGCQRISMEATSLPQVKQIIKAPQRAGLCFDQSSIVAGGNSGYQAINLAAHYKPKEMFLLGYDMKHDNKGNYNVRGDHPPEIKGKGKFSSFIARISTLAEPLEHLGISVYNCSLDSDLDCFPRRKLEDVL